MQLVQMFCFCFNGLSRKQRVLKCCKTQFNGIDPIPNFKKRPDSAGKLINVERLQVDPLHLLLRVDLRLHVLPRLKACF